MSIKSLLSRLAPTVMTACGFVLGLFAVSEGSWVAGAASLACDVADGWLARRLRASSDFGAMLDWCTDTVLAVALVLIWFPAAAHPYALSGLILWQAVHAELDIAPHRTSGRALLWVPWLVWLAL